MGTSWPTDLTPDQCLLSSDWKKEGVEEGDDLIVPSNKYLGFWRAVGNIYNYLEVGQQFDIFEAFKTEQD